MVGKEVSRLVCLSGSGSHSQEQRDAVLLQQRHKHSQVRAQLIHVLRRSKKHAIKCGNTHFAAQFLSTCVLVIDQLQIELKVVLYTHFS